MANLSNTSFSLNKKDVVFVKPSKPTPSEVLSFSSIDNYPDLEIMCYVIYVYQAPETEPELCSQADPAIIIEKALSEVLVFFYPLAGKLKRQSDSKLQINCCADGVPFVVATADCQLSSLNYLDGIENETAREFVFEFSSSNDNDGYHPLVLQVTKFSCGGFTIGLGLSHSVCDGTGAGHLLRALFELASGKSEPTVKPVWEREKLVAKPSQEVILPKDVHQSNLATSPYLPTTDILHGCFNVSPESIKKLKVALMKECEDDGQVTESFTTLEVLAAYVWRSRLRALKLNLDGITFLCFALGLRSRLTPRLPDGYYGNAFISSNIELTGRELDSKPLSNVVKLIQERKKFFSNNDNIWNAIGIMQKEGETNKKTEVIGAMMLTDWRQLGLIEEIDFGWKGSVNMVTLPCNIFGYVDYCLFLPYCNSKDPSLKGGVRVLCSLPTAAMAKFKEEMDLLASL